MITEAEREQRRIDRALRINDAIKSISIDQAFGFSDMERACDSTLVSWPLPKLKRRQNASVYALRELVSSFDSMNDARLRSLHGKMSEQGDLSMILARFPVEDSDRGLADTDATLISRFKTKLAELRRHYKLHSAYGEEEYDARRDTHVLFLAVNGFIGNHVAHRFMPLLGPRDLCLVVASTPPFLRNYNEIIQSYEACKMHFDIDVDVDSEDMRVRSLRDDLPLSYEDIRISVTTLCRLAVMIMNETMTDRDGAPLQLAADDFLILESNRPQYYAKEPKISFHAIVGCEAGFPNREVLRQAAAVITAMMLKIVTREIAVSAETSGICHGHLEIFRRCFHFRKYKRINNPASAASASAADSASASAASNPWSIFKLGCLMDVVIYSKGKREFRLPGCAKADDGFQVVRQKLQGAKAKDYLRFLKPVRSGDLQRPWHHSVVHFYPQLCSNPRVIKVPDEAKKTGFEYIRKCCNNVNELGYCPPARRIIKTMNALVWESNGRRGDPQKAHIWQALFQLRNEHTGVDEDNMQSVGNLENLMLARVVAGNFVRLNKARYLRNYLLRSLKGILEAVKADGKVDYAPNVAFHGLEGGVGMCAIVRFHCVETGFRFCLFCQSENNTNMHKLTLTASMDLELYCFKCGSKRSFTFHASKNNSFLVPDTDPTRSSMLAQQVERLENETVVRPARMPVSKVAMGIGALRKFAPYHHIYRLEPLEERRFHDIADLSQIFGPQRRGGEPTSPLLGPSTLVLWSSMGTGKTELIAKVIEELPEEASVLSISFRRMLAAALASRLGLVNYRKDGRIDRAALTEPRLSIQLDSLRHIFTPEAVVLEDGTVERAMIGRLEYDVVVLDEFTSLMSHVVSETLSEHREVTLYIMIELIRKAKVVIFSDADMDDTAAQWIESLRPPRQQNYFRVHINRLSPYMRVYCLMPYMCQWFQRAETVLREGKNLFIVCPGKHQCRALEAWFVEFVHVRLGFQDVSDVYAVKAITGDDTEKTKESMADTKSWENYRVLIVNSVLGAGLDYSANHFEETMVFIGSQEVTPRNVMQLLARVRAPRSGRVSIYLHTNITVHETDGLSSVEMVEINSGGFEIPECEAPPPLPRGAKTTRNYAGSMTSFVLERVRYQKRLSNADYLRTFLMQILSNYIDPRQARMFVQTDTDSSYDREVSTQFRFGRYMNITEHSRSSEVAGYLEHVREHPEDDTIISRGYKTSLELARYFYKGLNDPDAAEELLRHTEQLGGMRKIQMLANLLLSTKEDLQLKANEASIPTNPVEYLQRGQELEGVQIWHENYDQVKKKRRVLIDYLEVLGSPPEAFREIEQDEEAAGTEEDPILQQQEPPQRPQQQEQQENYDDDFFTQQEELFTQQPSQEEEEEEEEEEQIAMAASELDEGGNAAGAVGAAAIPAVPLPHHHVISKAINLDKVEVHSCPSKERSDVAVFHLHRLCEEFDLVFKEVVKADPENPWKLAVTRRVLREVLGVPLSKQQAGVCTQHPGCKVATFDVPSRTIAKLLMGSLVERERAERLEKGHLSIYHKASEIVNQWIAEDAKCTPFLNLHGGQQEIQEVLSDLRGLCEEQKSKNRFFANTYKGSIKKKVEERKNMWDLAIPTLFEPVTHAAGGQDGFSYVQRQSKVMQGYIDAQKSNLIHVFSTRIDEFRGLAPDNDDDSH